MISLRNEIDDLRTQNVPAYTLTVRSGKINFVRWLLIGALFMTVGGCSAKFDPESSGQLASLDEVGFKQRAKHKVKGSVSVRVAALSAKESLAAFGVALAKKKVQPVWIEVQNNSDQRYLFLPIAVDPDYFAPFEVAWKYRYSSTDTALQQIGLHLESYQMPFYIEAGETASGFVFASLDQGVKAVPVDLIGDDRSVLRFDFVVAVPGLRADFLEKDWNGLMSRTEFVEVDADGLRTALSELPCCALGGDGNTPGDPLNIVVIGDIQNGELLFPFVRRGWDLTEVLSAGAVWSTIKSSLFGARYRYAPMSPLYLYGRVQDIGMQKARRTVDERNHLRLWMTPLLYEDKHVFVGQISRDIGIKLSSKTLVTHKIDPDVDETREYLSQDLLKSGQLEALGYTQHIAAVLPSDPRYNYTRDPYWTDGLMAVLILSNENIDLNQVEFLNWSWPGQKIRKTGSSTSSTR